MRYIIVDAALHGTGIRDYYGGGYIEPERLNLDSGLIKRVNDWLIRYENEHYNGFSNKKLVEDLDCEGISIARIIKDVLSDVKIDYFSTAKMIKEEIV